VNDFRVELGAFEGPLDLLLYLAKVNEVDIADIPITLITEQYLRYIELMEMLNIEMSSDFLVMASALMEIKSRMLVPAPEIEDDEEMEDPRLDLIQQLIEYKKVKEVAKDLDAKAAEQATKFPRAIKKSVVAEFSLDTVDLWDLIGAFDRVMKQVSYSTSREIVDDDLPVRFYMDRIIERLKQCASLGFENMFDGIRDKAGLLGTFLALLELGRLRQVRIEQKERFGDILVSYAGAGEPAGDAESAAQEGPPPADPSGSGAD
jgi:segregation and condensation protein A